MSQSESRGSGRRITPEAVDSMMILQNCFVTVSRLNQLHYDEPNYITENKPPMQSMFESLKPSLDICYNILNKILYYMQQLGPAFCGGFLQDCLLCLQLNVHAPC
jgi:hypothetical protein